jgi:lipoprotein-anchoring transpeptidase ErfK/SrfK
LKRSYVAKTGLGIATACLITAGTISVAIAAPQPAAQAMSADIVTLQVRLDRLGFGPGAIDGKRGQSLANALTGFQKAGGLKVSGRPDPATIAAIEAKGGVPGIIEVTLTPAMLAGPFVALPPKEADQAKLPALGYANVMEKLSEMFHTTPATLIALNDPKTQVVAGAKIKVPNVLAAERAYDADLKPDWRQTLDTLNVSSTQPKAAKVVVDKSDGVLMVYDEGGKLVAQFPATMGSSHDPLPIGSWKIQGASYNPPFHFNPKLFWDAGAGEKKALLPPGPNGPVGVVWLDLSKPHYGIHGTPHPEKIGRTESHGCIRLTNWDAARLALMVKPGTPAIFQQ